MKQINFLSALLFALSFALANTASIYAQTTYNSVTDGNWSDPATWDCNCLPATGNFLNTVNILHDVSLDIDIVSLPMNTDLNIAAGGEPEHSRRLQPL